MFGYLQYEVGETSKDITHISEMLQEFTVALKFNETTNSYRQK